MKKIIIVDDEINNQALLQSMCAYLFADKYIIVAMASNVKEAIAQISMHQPDVVLLDIELPDGNGFDILDYTKHLKFFVIFTTAYEQYAIRAIKYNALDYLLKPLQEQELKTAFELLETKNVIEENKKIADLMMNVPNKGPLKKITINTQEKTSIIDLDIIVKLNSSGNYTYIYTSDNQTICATKQLGDFEELLKDANFIRPHHSWLVNLSAVALFSKKDDKLFLQLKDKSQVPVSYRKANEIKRILNA
jgi:two-component system, LytTR family, response regulator